LITICEVGPRDGLQNERDVLPPETRAELVNRLATTGLGRIEVVSFVRDDAVVQMAGAEDVVDNVERRDGVEYTGLVLNEKGFERFQASGLDRVNVTLGATESFNQRNANASLDDATKRASRIATARPAKTTVTISVAFGCPFEGRVDPAVVSGLAVHFRRLGVDEIVLADTIGVATPR
jgi:isopropylmalate/homocitrate/citramalate synthase